MICYTYSLLCMVRKNLCLIIISHYCSILSTSTFPLLSLTLTLPEAYRVSCLPSGYTVFTVPSGYSRRCREEAVEPISIGRMSSIVSKVSLLLPHYGYLILDYVISHCIQGLQPCVSFSTTQRLHLNHSHSYPSNCTLIYNYVTEGHSFLDKVPTYFISQCVVFPLAIGKLDGPVSVGL